MAEHQSKIEKNTSETMAEIAHKGNLEATKNSSDFSFINLPIQPKLSVGAIDDPLEREADAVADTIMRMPEQSFIQRKCDSCEEEDKLRRKPITSFIQKKSLQGGIVVSDSVSNQINSSRGKGSPLSGSTKSFMESRFETDFSNVGIHTNSEAANLSRDLGAKAFTVGNDIYFNSGQYAPDTSEGKHLLAHELTHTLQQVEVKNTLQKDELIQKQAAPGRRRNLWIHVGFDSSASTNETTMSLIRDSIATLRASINHCCTETGNSCNIRVRTLYDWNRMNKPAPSDGDYDGDVAADAALRDSNIANINTGRAGGIRMLVTGSSLSQTWQGARITARANTDPANDNIIWDLNVAPADTLAHETGHVADYSGGDIEGNDHSSDPDNIMSGGNIRNAGALPDANWCQQVDILSRVRDSAVEISPTVHLGGLGSELGGGGYFGLGLQLGIPLSDMRRFNLEFGPRVNALIGYDNSFDSIYGLMLGFRAGLNYRNSFGNSSVSFGISGFGEAGGAYNFGASNSLLPSEEFSGYAEGGGNLNLLFNSQFRLGIEGAGGVLDLGRENNPYYRIGINLGGSF